MIRGAMRALPLAAALIVAPAAIAQQAQTAQTPPPQHSSAEAQPKGELAAKCQEMMKHHEQMMADQKTADQRLDSLVAKMNGASGQAKVDATAAVVTEMVAQRKAMHQTMMKMHHGAMTHMAEHMQGGAESMAMCPMMGMKKQ